RSAVQRSVATGWRGRAPRRQRAGLIAHVRRCERCGINLVAKGALTPPYVRFSAGRKLLPRLLAPFIGAIGETFWESKTPLWTRSDMVDQPPRVSHAHAR